MGKIFVTSDWHFGHDKAFVYDWRGFDTIGAMNERIIYEFNKVVDPDDDVYVLGDCIMGRSSDTILNMKRLNGKLHIICGNHDTENRREMYAELPNVVEICDGKYLKFGHWHFWLSHFPMRVANYDDDKKPWQRSYCLCGHTHTTDRWEDFTDMCAYNVSVDAHDCKPVNLEQICHEILNYEA